MIIIIIKGFKGNKGFIFQQELILIDSVAENRAFCAFYFIICKNPQKKLEMRNDWCKVINTQTRGGSN